MAWGAVICLPYIISLLLPAFEYSDKNNNSWYFSQLFVYVIILAFSLLNGIGEGMAQTSQGKYIADCATENNKGFFFSFFWACYMGS